MAATRRTHTGSRGSVLPATLILVLVVGIYSSATINAATAVAIADVEADQQLRLMSAANAGVELLRTQMFFSNINEFQGYIGSPPDYPADLTNASGDLVMNGAVVTWDVLADPDGVPGVARVEVQATIGTDYLKVIQEFELPHLAGYAFASNDMHDGDDPGMGVDNYIPTTDWYGKVYWYSNNGTYPNFTGTQTFYGELESWEFPDDGQSRPHQFVDDDGNVIADPVAAQLWDAHTYDDGQFVPFGEAINTANDDGADEGIFNPDNPDGYPSTADYKFDGSGALPENVELFLSPDGDIWWRDLGEGPADWNVLGPQTNGVVYVEGTALVRGAVTSKMTIAAGDIIVNGNIVRTDDSTSALGLISQDDIYYENRAITSGNKIQEFNTDTVPATFFDDAYYYKPGSGWRQTSTSGLSVGDSWDWLTSVYWHFGYGKGGAGARAERSVTPSAGTSFNYLAQPVFDSANSGHSTIKAALLALDSSFWQDQIDNWEAAGAVLPAEAIIEASQYAGDKTMPTVDHNVYQVETDVGTFYKQKGISSSSWRSGGTRFSSGAWPNSTSMWTTRISGEHRYAWAVHPPGFLTINEGHPIIVPGEFEFEIGY